MKSGTFHHLLKLDDDQKRALRKTPDPIRSEREFLGRSPAATAVSESGLYRLRMRADGAKAKPFRDWVVREVLPSIRKTTEYRLEDPCKEVI